MVNKYFYYSLVPKITSDRSLELNQMSKLNRRFTDLNRFVNIYKKKGTSNPYAVSWDIDYRCFDVIDLPLNTPYDLSVRFFHNILGQNLETSFPRRLFCYWCSEHRSAKIYQRYSVSLITSFLQMMYSSRQ